MEQNLFDEMICANSKHKCLISIDKINDENVVKLEFNITGYQVYTNAWINYTFPIDTIINNSLYLDHSLKNEIVEALDIYARTECLSRQYPTDDLGFPYNEWKDIKGNSIKILDPGFMNAPAILFGCNIQNVLIKNGNKVEEYNFPDNYQVIGEKITLTPQKAKELKEIIEKQWVLAQVRDLEENLPIQQKNKNTMKI
jgi:hypothetical protein